MRRQVSAMGEAQVRGHDTEQPRAGRAHPKPSRTWCKGKVGVAHVPVVVVPVNASRRECDPTRYDHETRWGGYTWEVGCFHVEACETCGKHLRPFLARGECPTRTPEP